MKPPVDRKLVVALIAVELGYVDREALIAGISSWSVAKDQPLGESLLGGFPLDSEILLRLESLADLILRLNSEDPIASLVSRTLEDGLTEDLRRSLTSTEVLDSLATRFPSTDTSLPATHADDPYATRVDSSAPTCPAPGPTSGQVASAIGKCVTMPGGAWARCSSPRTRS